MPRQRFEAAEADENLRLDVFLARSGVLSRSAFARLCERGEVTLDGRPAGKNHRVAAGEVFTADWPDPAPSAAAAQDIPLDIVYEDEDLIVVNKPRGLVVHPAAGHADGTLVNALLHHCRGGLSGIGGVARPGIVHRLDKDTSGLLVAAKNDAAHLALSGQLAGREMTRVYEGLAAGALPGERGVWRGAIGRDPKNRKRMAVVTAGGRPAVTHYRVLARLPGATHVECRLETGRTHQIRAHLRAAGHPLLGDSLYGGPDLWALRGQCLHAASLRLIHPRTGRPLRFEAARPDYFTAMLTRLAPQPAHAQDLV
ncbi:MAG: RluA family pseudouridine synthase [Oscillospiraceae bacterium]|jgi:23S rRNA pseudouridine1911/1915/1917 synthase|nr:RluA family pseudouridine synthase [Oscillospiraceae bacterium]